MNDEAIKAALVLSKNRQALPREMDGIIELGYIPEHDVVWVKYSILSYWLAMLHLPTQAFRLDNTEKLEELTKERLEMNLGSLLKKVRSSEDE